MDEPELRPLGLEEVGLLYRRELKGTFPPSELKPLRTIQRHKMCIRDSAQGVQGELISCLAALKGGGRRSRSEQGAQHNARENPGQDLFHGKQELSLIHI